jgi:hypothetical protein
VSAKASHFALLLIIIMKNNNNKWKASQWTSMQAELFQQLWLNMFAKYCIFCSQNQKVALTNQEIMNIAPALILIGSIILLVSRVEGHQSLHALSQVFIHSPSAWNLLLCPSSRMTWITISLSAISQQGSADTLILHDSAEYLTAFEAWRSERGAAEQDCMLNGNALLGVFCGFQDICFT